MIEKGRTDFQFALSIAREDKTMKFLLKRILQAIPVLLVVSIFAFYLVNVAPGDPALSYRTPDMTDEAYEQIRDNFGLNDPLYVQYMDWGKNILTGNWGMSISTQQPVIKMILQKLPATVGLMLSSLVFLSAPLSQFLFLCERNLSLLHRLVLPQKESVVRQLKSP